MLEYLVKGCKTSVSLDGELSTLFSMNVSVY